MSVRNALPRRLCSRFWEVFHLRTSLKMLHRTVFLTHRLQHSRLASCINALPQTPCCGSSSNSLFPPPAAVVLVTSSPVTQIQNKKTGHPRGYPVFLVRVTGLEPAHRLTLEPKSSASANSATPARVYFNKLNLRKSKY